MGSSTDKFNMFTIAVKNEKSHEQRTLTCWALSMNGCAELHSGWRVFFEPEEEGENQSPLEVASRIKLAGQTEEELDLTIRFTAAKEGLIELTNRGRSIALSHGPRIHRGRTIELTLPISFRVCQTQVQVLDARNRPEIDQGITTVSQKLTVEHETQVSPGPETLAAWLETLSDLQRVAAGSQALLDLATQAIFNPGGLDGCLLLSREDHQWKIASSHLPYPDNGISYRQELVQAAFESGETIYHDATVIDAQECLDGLHTAVVCPVIGPDDQIDKVLYGFRSLHRRNLRKGIRFLEAQFVQVVADSLSAGMIRLSSEAEAARSIVLLEQAFPPRVARQLIHGPQVLEPRCEEVTVLFADLRSFSSIAESHGPQFTFDLLRDVMDQMSNAITDLDGVIIDFFGDGISAFWNAPVAQPEHALLACQAGIEILNALPVLNQEWAGRVGHPLRFGIGIHTGPAIVGNSGSRSRLKYGPQGTTVNLASRLESWTKELSVPLLISESTNQKLAGVFPTRRVSTIQPQGHQNQLEVFTLDVLPTMDEGASTVRSLPKPANLDSLMKQARS